MAKRKDKKAERVKQLFNQVNSNNRVQWEYINQKGYDFSNDNQLTETERELLEQQGMPTFTINRITPVVEMLNFYATANTPRWQAVATEGSDTDVAAVFSDMADYMWYNSDASTLYANAINDSITKSIGYLQVTVDVNQDHGMGEVVIKQPEPFDLFVDPKSRDMLFRDASYIMLRKILPKKHLYELYPEYKTKIKNATADNENQYDLSEKSYGTQLKDFGYKDITHSESLDPDSAEHDDLIEVYEMYEKENILYCNVFFRIPPNEEQISNVRNQVRVQIAKMAEEMNVQLLEQQQEMQMAVQEGKMLPERFELEMKNAKEMMDQQIQAAEKEMMSELITKSSVIDNKIITKKEFTIMQENEDFAKYIVDSVEFYQPRIKHTTVVGDKTLFDIYLPPGITEYPIIPFHYKWTGTPYPISAVSPLVGKQRELNKAHQIMVHNASLGSSLRYLYEEGSVDTDYWEKYSSSPGALLPVRPGATPPTPIQPAPLSNAFFGIVQEGKGDMEYLAGIYSSMMGDTGSQADTYRGMLAMDEYGTRRIKQWLTNSIEPALKHLGVVMMQFSQAVYTAEKVFRIVQPNNIKEEKEVRINVPMYNDFGDVIGKFNDYASAKFDVRIIAGSTLPVNRWAYLEELKQLMSLGVIDDIALLAETDIRNKDKIAQRKSLYSQLQSQMQSMQESLKDKEGTIETLERQLVQAGIKGKVMQAEMEITKKKEQEKANVTVAAGKVKNDQITQQQKLAMEVANEQNRMKQNVNNIIRKVEIEKDSLATEE
tara:strand:- start:7038 stop:9353 length:2316 start_codon:yes stop_codon:yes gene_type:complete